MTQEKQPLLTLRGIGRSFPSGEQEVQVLKDVNLDIGNGEMLAIVGASGSGKSTLMNILGCLDRPSTGTYIVSGQDVGTLDSDALAQLRREHFGFIFQRYHLMPHLTATGNVEVPAVYAGTDGEARDTRARQLLVRLGLGDRTEHRPAAAGEHCARVDERRAGDPGRRADRRARQQERPGGDRHPARVACARAHHHHRDARHAGGELHRTHHRDCRWRDRG
jgi:macrolide transport system ATP-binding/permease protein